jgi:hypothetical protein
MGTALRYVKNQTEEICRLAVQHYGPALQYVENQTEEICKLAVEQNGWALQYVNDKLKTEEICTLAIKHNVRSVSFLKDTDFENEEFCIKLIKIVTEQNPSATLALMQNLNYQTEEICKWAVQKNGDAIRYVKPEYRDACKSVLLQE